jgi:RNA 3'-terminal phosphate cyclase (ATP)
VARCVTGFHKQSGIIQKRFAIKTMIVIDGSQGEGGGQILRSSLALSVVTGKAFRIERIRANREKPGLMRQHLTAVLAAAEVGGAEVVGAMTGATELTFVPRAGGAREIAGGEYRFAIGTAGSTSLVLQTVLPALMLAREPCTVVIEGGTHNLHAPPFEFLEKAFLPLLKRMGVCVRAEMERPGFYPAGGGLVRFHIEPCGELGRLELTQRGAIVRRRARAVVANLHRSIAEREVKTLKEKLGWADEELAVEFLAASRSPGNYVSIEIESTAVCEVVTGFGERGVMAERVAESAATEAASYIESGAVVGEHLADQLLVPMALAGGGAFTTVEPSLHTRTNIEVIKKFLDVEIATHELGGRVHKIEVKSGRNGNSL